MEQSSLNNQEFCLSVTYCEVASFYGVEDFRLSKKLSLVHFEDYQPLVSDVVDWAFEDEEDLVG